MLLFDESKALEKAFGEEAAAVLAKVMERQDKESKAELATKADIQGLKADILLSEANMRAELHKELKQTKTELIKWMVGLFIVGQAGVIFLILRSMLK